MIRILIVDDSPSVREFLRHILEKAGGFEIVGEAADGGRAVDLAVTLRPDVIAMDISMPVLDGLAATRAIMAARPTPIVIVSGHWIPEEVARTFEALGAGALAILEKPRFGSPAFERQEKQLVTTLRLMSGVRVVSRQARGSAPRPVQAKAEPLRQARCEAVAMGASTGGPQALRAILSALPAGFAAPIAVVQHISRGFLPGLVQWLDDHSSLTVSIAADGQAMKPGTAYFAPDDRHMIVTRDLTIRLSEDPPIGTLRPSVGPLFHSMAEALGDRAIGVLLTGMGRDGARELLLMRERGALTIAQDECTSIVHGMPGEAIRLGAATHVLPLEEIAAKLLRMVGEPK